MICFLEFLGILTIICTLFLLSIKYYRSLKIDCLTDKWILVTGCDTGFGNKAARKFDTSGFRVFAACLTFDKMRELRLQCSENLIPLHLDVTDMASVEKAFGIVKNKLPGNKGLWALINNAGIVGPVGLCEWLGKEEFQKAMDVNLLGTIRVTNTFLPLVRLSKGRIVNTCSVVGRLAFSTGPYSVSKFCLEGYTDSLRQQMRLHGVTVHTIEPGGYATNITDADLTNSSMEKSFDALPDNVKDFYGVDMKQKLSFMTNLATYILGCSRLHQVVDAYLHAATARHPKTRYVVGWNAHLIFRPLWSLPTSLTDFILGMCYPLPRGSS